MPPINQRLARQVDAIMASLEEALEAGAPVRPPSARPPSDALAYATSPTGAGATSPFSLSSLSPFATRPLTATASTGATPPFAPATTSPFSMSTGGLFSTASRSLQATAAHVAKHPATTSLAQLETQLAESSDMPSCRPFELGDYFRRVGTFRAGYKWFDKPGALSPPQCARYGWTLLAQDLLTCEVCRGCLKVPSTLSSSATAADPSLKAVADQLTTAHAALCPWRGNASPATIASLLLPGQYGAPPSLPHGVSIGREALHRRALSLLPLAALPRLARTCEGYWQQCASVCGFADVEAWQDACLAIAGPSGPTVGVSATERERRWTAVALAILGWTVQGAPTATAKDAIIECVEDARTVGLWNFAPLHPSAQENAQEGPAAASASTSASASASTSAAASASTSAAASAAALAEMDPVNEHRAWSPWLETVGNDSVPAWMRVLALLLPSASAGRTMAGAPSTTPTSAAISQIIAAF